MPDELEGLSSPVEIRKAIEKASERAVSRMLKMHGFESEDALEDALAAMKSVAKERDSLKALNDSHEADKAKWQSELDAAKAAAESEKASRQEAIDEAVAELSIKSQLRDAGVRPEDMEYVLGKFVSKLASMDDAAAEAYELSSFVTELSPVVFVEGKAPPKAPPVVTEKKEESAVEAAPVVQGKAGEAAPVATVKASTGVGALPPKAVGVQTKDYSKASASEARARIQELLGTKPAGSVVVPQPANQ